VRFHDILEKEKSVKKRALTARLICYGNPSKRKENSMIRPTTPADTRVLLSITAGTALFSTADVEALNLVLAEYHEFNAELGHRSFTYEHEGHIIGFAYFAPAPLTDRAWTLWWIVVRKQTQARGIGGELLKHAEETVRAERGRLMVVETSSIPTYELTRKFYLKNGYHVGATIADYYADGNDIVYFCKRL
jgi:ribosomal protein S18 acetylase RimI-like enzyme